MDYNINKKNTFIYMEVLYMDNNKKLYDAFLNYSYGELLDLLKKAKTEEERDFYAMLSNLVLKREAKKVIGK